MIMGGWSSKAPICALKPNTPITFKATYQLQPERPSVKMIPTLGVVLGPEMRLARTLEPDPDHTGVGKGHINGLPSSPLDCLAV